jgi:hypothetical protein
MVDRRLQLMELVLIAALVDHRVEQVQRLYRLSILPSRYRDKPFQT